VVTDWSQTAWLRRWRFEATLVSMTPRPSPKDKIEKLRRTGDPRASDAAKKLIRETCC